MLDDLIDLIGQDLIELTNYGYTGNDSFEDLVRILKHHPLVNDFRITEQRIERDVGASISKHEDKVNIIQNCNSKRLYRSLDDMFFPSVDQVMEIFPSMTEKNDEMTRYYLNCIKKLTLGHEISHMLQFCKKDGYIKKIRDSLPPPMHFDDCLSMGETESFCDIFSSFISLPPEKYFKESRNDLMKLGNHECFLEGIVSLCKKRDMDLYSLQQRLNLSDFHDWFPDHFCCIFKPSKGIYAITSSIQILPQGVKLNPAEKVHSSISYLALTEGIREDVQRTVCQDLFPDLWWTSRQGDPAVLLDAFKQLDRSEMKFIDKCVEFVTPYSEARISEVSACGYKYHPVGSQGYCPALCIAGKIKRS